MYLPITDKYILHSRPTSSDRPGKARCKRRAATCHGQLNLWQTTVLRRCPNQQITWVRSGLSPERWQVTLKMHLKAILIAFWKISEQWNPVFAWEVPTMQSEALHTLHKLSFPDPLCSLLCYIRMFLKSTLMSVVCIKNVNCQKKNKKKLLFPVPGRQSSKKLARHIQPRNRYSTFCTKLHKASWRHWKLIVRMGLTGKMCTWNIWITLSQVEFQGPLKKFVQVGIQEHLNHFVSRKFLS